MNNNPSAPQDRTYRPRNPGNDYYDRGIYLVTLVTRGRDRLLATLNDDPRNPESNPTDIGKKVMECWIAIPAFNAPRGCKIIIRQAVCMPDHFHGIIEIKERMPISLGDIICGFKTGCTKYWRHYAPRPCTAEGQNEPYMAHSKQPYADPHLMSRSQRLAYYAALPRSSQPLFDDDYDDTICLTDPVTGLFDQRHLKAMTDYVSDNPRRAIIRRLRPDFMQRCLHITIGGRDYAAFGNLFLLRWARKVQVFCHRKARLGQLTSAECQRFGYTYQASPDIVTHIPYEDTQAFRAERDRWLSMVMQGQTVIVTPGISKGELLMKKECLERGLPLIHLQKEPIGRYWKPERERFNAMAMGYLLILAPWQPEEMGAVCGVPAATDYSQFHNLNRLAEEICRGDIIDMRIK